MRCSELCAGETAFVTGFLDIPSFYATRLKQFGIKLGATVKRPQGHCFGPMLLQIGDLRIALDKKLAQQVIISQT